MAVTMKTRQKSFDILVWMTPKWIMGYHFRNTGFEKHSLTQNKYGKKLPKHEQEQILTVLLLFFPIHGKRGVYITPTYYASIYQLRMTSS